MQSYDSLLGKTTKNVIGEKGDILWKERDWMGIFIRDVDLYYHRTDWHPLYSSILGEWTLTN